MQSIRLTCLSLDESAQPVLKRVSPGLAWTQLNNNNDEALSGLAVLLRSLIADDLHMIPVAVAVLKLYD